MPQQPSGEPALVNFELGDGQTGLSSEAGHDGLGTGRFDDSWLVVPGWWAALIPVGYDYCNARNAPRFALLVGLVTAVIVAYQHMVRSVGLLLLLAHPPALSRAVAYFGDQETPSSSLWYRRVIRRAAVWG